MKGGTFFLTNKYATSRPSWYTVEKMSTELVQYILGIRPGKRKNEQTQTGPGGPALSFNI